MIYVTKQSRLYLFVLKLHFPLPKLADDLLY